MPTRAPAYSTGRIVLIGWLVAGTLDLSDAVLFSLANGVSVDRVLRYIASGLLGPAARTGGPVVPLLGLGMHYLIALAWTVLYITVARRLPALRRYAVLAGSVYGLIVFFVMKYVAVPLSRIGHMPHFKAASLLNAVLALVLCIGLPLALIDRYFSRASQPV